jgi:histidinol dehydrogenase
VCSWLRLMRHMGRRSSVAQLHTVRDHCPPASWSTHAGVVAVMQVEPIVQSVRKRGDAAVREFTEKFDRATVDTVCVPIEVRLPSQVSCS